MDVNLVWINASFDSAFRYNILVEKRNWLSLFRPVREVISSMLNIGIDILSLQDYMPPII